MKAGILILAIIVILWIGARQRAGTVVKVQNSPLPINPNIKTGGDSFKTGCAPVTGVCEPEQPVTVAPIPQHIVLPVAPPPPIAIQTPQPPPVAVAPPPVVAAPLPIVKAVPINPVPVRATPILPIRLRGGACNCCCGILTRTRVSTRLPVLGRVLVGHPSFNPAVANSALSQRLGTKAQSIAFSQESRLPTGTGVRPGSIGAYYAGLNTQSQQTFDMAATMFRGGGGGETSGSALSDLTQGACTNYGVG